MLYTIPVRALGLLAIISMAGCLGDEPVERQPVGAPCGNHGDCATGLCLNSVCDDPDRVGSPDPTPDPQPGPQPEPTPDPQPAPQPDPEPVPTPDQAPEPTPDPEPAPQPDPQPEPEPDPQPDPMPDPTPDPVDCSPLSAREGWQLCRSTDTSCEGVFTDSTGCGAFCQAAGLDCGGVFEDIGGQCAPDLDRPELSCAPNGHQSDYCVCVADDCTPQCQGRECGSDGCGGVCDVCGEGLVCQQGQCVERDDNPDEDCNRYPFRAETLLAERLGFGRRATGGDPDQVYRVTTRANSGSGSLRQALESDAHHWIVFDVEGEIRLSSRINVRSNKTIDGRGRDVTINGNLVLRDARHIIVSDVRLTNDQEGHCTQEGDVVTIQGEGTDDPRAFTSRDIWFNHVELFNGGDGLFDIRGGSDITLSWSHLHTHKKAILAWKDIDGRVTSGMQVTFHHNFFDRVSLRGPQFIHGKAHFLNNYQYHWYEYGAGGLGGAQLYSEGNVYEARPDEVCVVPCPDPAPCGDSDFFVSKLGLVSDWASNGEGYTVSEGDLTLNDAILSVNSPERVFAPADIYDYSADEATGALADRIREGAGPRTGYCR